jgi:transcriptional regulator with XRE-family HTH domain
MATVGEMGVTTHEAWWRAQRREGLRLAEWRTAQGWSQETLADRAGLAHSTVTALETGTLQPDLRTIHTLARALGVAFWALYEEPGTVLPGAVTLLAELYDIDAVIGDDPEEAVAAVLTYLATRPADEAVTANLSRIAGRLERFARAMRVAFPPR